MTAGNPSVVKGQFFSAGFKVLFNDFHKTFNFFSREMVKRTVSSSVGTQKVF